MQNPQLGHSFCFSATIGEETNEAKESNTTSHAKHMRWCFILELIHALD